MLVRVDPAKVDQVLTVLGATANPGFAEEVEVDKRTDALETQEDADDTLTTLFLGLSAVPLIGGIAGLYPATRAARLSPTEALRTT